MSFPSLSPWTVPAVALFARCKLTGGSPLRLWPLIKVFSKPGQLLVLLAPHFTLLAAIRPPAPAIGPPCQLLALRPPTTGPSGQSLAREVSDRPYPYPRPSISPGVSHQPRGQPSAQWPASGLSGYRSSTCLSTWPAIGPLANGVSWPAISPPPPASHQPSRPAMALPCLNVSQSGRRAWGWGGMVKKGERGSKEWEKAGKRGGEREGGRGGAFLSPDQVYGLWGFTSSSALRWPEPFLTQAAVLISDRLVSQFYGWLSAVRHLHAKLGEATGRLNDSEPLGATGLLGTNRALELTELLRATGLLGTNRALELTDTASKVCPN